jgi:hypothetical protein
VLCCAVLCCAVLCCAVLCCAVLCCAVLCCAAVICSLRLVSPPLLSLCKPCLFLRSLLLILSVPARHYCRAACSWCTIADPALTAALVMPSGGTASSLGSTTTGGSTAMGRRVARTSEGAGRAAPTPPPRWPPSAATSMTLRCSADTGPRLLIPRDVASECCIIAAISQVRAACCACHCIGTPSPPRDCASVDVAEHASVSPSPSPSPSASCLCLWVSLTHVHGFSSVCIGGRCCCVCS